ncbi:hypothetical protein [Spirosoma fluviale]|uniref:Uncharacterized protein n=1 Tax=Spirosoma fluviale TaxID=1597977 RepID=A0A286FCT9_9BACT|nr:hypothetical protein [Spirosoma fluviale]SOD81013.1 hypothetical protein SAMN06269250_1645 [Spirosoma fluviale]
MIDIPLETQASVSVQDLYRPVALMSRLPDMPLQRGDKAWIWWKEQIKRCRYGWWAPDGHYLNGYQYFYLNFMQIPVQDEKLNIAEWRQPWYRDNDETIFGYLWRNTSRSLANGKAIPAKNHIEAKCRSIGWTQITLLGVAMWTFIFRPDRAIGMGYSDDEVIGIERLWFQESWAKLHPMFRTWKGQLLEPLYNNKDTFTVGYKDKKNPKIIKEHNNVQFKIIADKAGVFKGQRLNLIIAIEAGKWKGDSLKNFYNENLDCLEMGSYKWGMFLIGGTSNVIINKSTNYKDIYFNYQAYNATRHFTSKSMVLSGFYDLKTGISDQAAAMQHILATRKSREGDPQSYQQYLIENPLTDQECFTPNESFAYDAARINQQVAFLKANGFDTLWRRGRLDYEKDYTNNRRTGRIKFYEDPNGKWLINLEGLPNARYKNLHIAAVDDTYKGADEEKLRARDSRNCMVIYRQPTSHNIKSDMPVAVFLHQTPEMDDIYEEFLKGLKYYDVNQCLYEYNHDGFVKYLRQAGELRRLYYVGGNPGLSVKGKVKTELTYLGNMFFRDGRFQNITSLEILHALSVWGTKENTDIGSAFHLILYLLDATKEREVTLKNGETDMADKGMPSQRVVLGVRPVETPKPALVASGGDNRPGADLRGAERKIIKLGPQPSTSTRLNYPRTQYA